MYHILFDCDPGIDDAVAFAVAAAHREQLRLHGITTVAGNQTIERVTGNALKLASFLGLDVEVARGAAGPLLRTAEDAGDVHGTTGLGNCELPAADRQAVKEPAAAFLYRKLQELPPEEHMVFVATGPLTNVALLLKAFPDSRERISRIVLMGGAAVGGNVTATAEFNIWEDPEAAAMVFASGVPIVMCGLDVTMKCGLTKEQAQQLLSDERPKPHAYGEMLSFYFQTTEYENGERMAIHDAVTFLYLLHPEIFSGHERAVIVDCSEGLNRGMTVCDMRGFGGQRPNALVLDAVDADAFGAYLMETLQKE